MLRVTAATIALLAPAAAFANGYTGLQLSRIDYTEDWVDATANPTALVLRGGNRFSQRFSMEGRIGFGIADDTVSVGGTDVTFEADRLLSILAKGHMPFGEGNSGAYAAVGYTDAKASISYPGYSGSMSESGMSYGFGVEVDVSRGAGLSLEWMSYLDGSSDGVGYELSTVSLGMHTSF